MSFINPLFSGLNTRQRTQQQPVEQTRTTYNRVKFGCRLFAYISPKQYEGQDVFIKQCLLTGQNSMKRQNQLPHLTAGSENPQLAADDYHEEIAPEAYAYKAGWGIAASREDVEGSLTIVKKSPFPTWADKTYDQTAKEVAEAHPKVVMTHLREAQNAVKHAEPVEKNAHPFKIGDWALMQHGSFPTETATAIDEVLNKLHATNKAVGLSESEVDTERVARYLAEKLRQQTGSTNIRNVPTEQLARLFKDTVSEIIRWPDPKGATYKTEEYPGTFNFVLSDGNRMFISRYTSLQRRPLYLGTHQAANGKTEYVVATDTMQPTDESGLEKIDWKLLPNNSLTVLERSDSASDNAKVSVRPTQTLVEPLKPITVED